MLPSLIFFFFFFNDTATTEIYTLSLHDALPIFEHPEERPGRLAARVGQRRQGVERTIDVRGAVDEDQVDRKSTRLNSSHSQISYAVFCLKKKKKKKIPSSSLEISHAHRRAHDVA